MVKERGSRLRQLPFAELKQLANEPVENVTIGSREGTLGIIMLPMPSGGIQVVVQGFLEHLLMPGKSVELDGFYKYPDENVAEMESQEFSDFD